MNTFVRNIIFITFLGCSTLVGTASASGLTLTQYRDWQRDPIKKEMLNTYTAGMGQGITFANVYNKTQKIPMIFCPPNELPLTGDLTNNILAKFIAKKNVEFKTEVQH